jgi:hypothetical protein
MIHHNLLRFLHREEYLLKRKKLEFLVHSASSQSKNSECKHHSKKKKFKSYYRKNGLNSTITTFFTI